MIAAVLGYSLSVARAMFLNASLRFTFSESGLSNRARVREDPRHVAVVGLEHPGEQAGCGTEPPVNTAPATSGSATTSTSRRIVRHIARSAARRQAALGQHSPPDV